MKILALETSTEYCSVALWQDGALSERCELVGQKHSEMLMAMIDGVLRDSGCRMQEPPQGGRRRVPNGSAITLAQIDGIAFGKGPGSFTGVRIACGVAQGLALGANLNVVGVCTLEALAQACGSDKVIAAIDARMGEIYFAAYEIRDCAWATLIEPCLCKVDDTPSVQGDGWFGVGSGFSVANAALQVRYENQLSGVDAQAVPQASAMARLAAIEFAKGNSVDAALALPLYLRDKVALKTSEREAARSTSTSSVRTEV